MKTFGSLLLCLAFCSVAKAGNITLTGQVLNSLNKPLPHHIYLKSISLSGNNTLDSVELDADGSYSISKSISQHALYSLFVGKMNYSLFLSPTESMIKITNENGDRQKIWIEGSKENDAYKVYRDLKSYYEPQIASLLNGGASRDSINKNLKVIYSNYFANLKNITTNYSETYTARELCKMKHFADPRLFDLQKDPLGFLREHYLDNLDYTKPELLEELTFDECFMGYVANVLDTSFAAFQQFAKKLDAEKKMDTAIYKYTRRQIFNFMMLAHEEQKVAYFIDLTLADERIHAAPVLETQMVEVKRLLPGNKLVEVEGTDETKANRKLSDFASKNKLTLLVFWEPSCSHCRASMPELKRLYDAYGKKGFNIFAANMDDDEAEWKKMIAEKNLNWTNVLMKKQTTQKDAAAEYHVFYTPTLVLISQQGKIIRRFIGINDLEGEIKTQLKL